MKKNKKKAGIVDILLTLLAMLMCLIFINYKFLKPEYQILPNEVEGEIIFEGFALSGSAERFWKLDLKNREFEILNDKSLIEYLTWLTLSSPDNNEDHDNETKTKQLNPISLFETLFSKDAIRRQRLLSRLEAINTDLITRDKGSLKIVSDHSSKTIKINSDTNKKPLHIKFDNDFCCQALSPDSNYLALLEYQPFAFNDGKSYKWRFINIKTGKIYTIEDNLVSLPTVISWLPIKDKLGSKHN